MGLGDETPVKRLLVVQGKAVQGIDMLQGDRQYPETVRRLLLLEENAQGLGKCQPAELRLDLDCPALDDADQYVATQIMHGAIGCRAQTRRLIMPLQQHRVLVFFTRPKSLGEGRIDIVSDHGGGNQHMERGRARSEMLWERSVWVF